MKRPRSAPRQPPAVGLVVEGETEYHALPQLHTKRLVAGCPPLKPTNLAGVGSHLTPQGIARRVVGSVRAHFAAGRQVVVCIDREQRTECAGELALAVRAQIVALLRAAPADRDLHVVVANRAFESWLLAGAVRLYEKGALKKRFKVHRFEGDHGKRGRKGVEELSDLLGRPYDKLRDGPRLFAQLDFETARDFEGGGRGSRSLDKLLRVLGV